MFCEDIIKGVKSSELAVSACPVVAQQKQLLLTIHEISQGFTF
jgi:hypothetical protein